MRVDRQRLDLAVAQFPIELYVATKGGQEAQPGQVVLGCPVCGREKLVVDVEKRVWKCWRCVKLGPPDERGRRRALAGAGDLVSLIELLEGLDFPDAAQYLIDQLGVQPGLLEQLPEVQAPPVMSAPVLDHRPMALPEYAGPPDCHALAYLYWRGLTDEDIQRLGVLYCAAGRYAGRVVFPVYERGQVVYWQARATWQARPGERHRKTLNPRRVPGQAGPSDVLLNLECAARYPRVAIVEGDIDCARTGPDAVATFGKQITATQIAKLVSRGVRAVDLMWDGPTPKEPRGAWDDMEAVAPLLASCFDTRLVYIPQDDPGSYDRATLWTFRARGIPVVGRLRQL